MDEKLQKILENKYNVIWKDSQNYDIEREKVNIHDPELKKKFDSYILNDDPLYYTFNYEPLIEVAQRPAGLHNLLQYRGIEENINNHTILKLPSSEPLFKGMRTFYREDQITESSDIKWFGEESIAFKYAKRYHGGINVYKPQREIKLLVYTNYQNILSILTYLEKNDKKAAFSLRIKTGINISIFKQMEYYIKYNNYYDGVWLTRVRPVSDISGQQVPVIKGMYLWGRGKIDRIVGAAICKYCKLHGFDGYISYEIYSPYMGYNAEEVVLCDYYRILDRLSSHPLDWLSWEKYLPIIIEPNFLLELSYSDKNNNFQIIKFWNYNKMNSMQNKKFHSEIINTKNKFVIATLNVHAFYSINHYNTMKFAFKKFLLLLNNFKIDVIGIQEFRIDETLSMKYVEKKLKKRNYNITFTECVPDFGNAIISKYTIQLFKELTLPNDQHFKMVRKATFFKIDKQYVDNIIFCNTHLEIGLRYKTRHGGLLSEDELIKNMNFNSQIRSKQLNSIINENPDIIMGDFNFNPDDPEFNIISNKYTTYMDNITSTNPFGTITDYLCYRKDLYLKPIKTVAANYRYSDHLPVISLFQI